MIRNKLLFLVLLPLFLFAQEQPRVGLVLSGGGAKGFAHIAAIRELEKAGVQIDYVGGTSMGAIIGSMYAVGYSADQIEELVRQADFASLLQDKIPRREKPYFEKTFVEKHAFTLPIEKGKIHLPLGLSKGQNALNLLTEILSPVDSIRDFSKLPIPFYCIATDIETGKEVVLEEGSLPLAIRASSSFPTLLNPVEVGDKLLVDGGVVNNFPADAMRAKGIDIIIGVNVQGVLSKRDKLTSIAGVLKQIVNFQMYSKSNTQIQLIDVYLRPNVKSYEVTSFNKINEILEEGTKEAKLFTKTFEEIAKKQTSKKIRKPVSFDHKNFLLDKIIIKGNKKYTRNYILGKLQLKEGDSVCYADISGKINTLTATNHFERIDYSFKNSFKGKKILLDLKEEEIKSFLRIGFHYDKLYESAVLLNYNHKNLFFSNDETSLDVIIGDNPRYDFQYFIDNGFLPSYGVSSRFNNFSTNIVFNDQNNGNRINLSYRDFTTSVFTQTILDKKFGFGFGLEHKKLTVKTESILRNNRESFFEDSSYFSSFVFLKLDTFNKKVFPTKGFYADFNFKWYMASTRNKNLDKLVEDSSPFSQFSQINGTVSGVFNFRKKLTFQYFFEAGYTLGDESTEIFDYRLGGYNRNTINNIKPFYGYDYGELSNQSYLKAELDARYEVFKNHYITGVVNYANVERDVFDFENIFGTKKTGYGVGYSVDTFVGPIELKYTWSPDHSDNFLLFNFGFWF